MRARRDAASTGQTRTRGRIVAALCAAGLAAVAAPAPADAARLQVTGGPRHVVQLCGERHVATVRTAGRRLGVAGRTGVLVDRCEAGRWVRSLRLRPRRRAAGRRAAGRHALPTRLVGDFRVRAGRRRAYYRVRPAGSRARIAPAAPDRGGAPGAGGAGDVVDVPVSFRVVNQNRSRVACRADGATYTVRGHLVAPRSALSGPGGRSVTVYMHGIGWTQGYWHFTAVAGYDYATELARAGHASVVYDQLGYGTSDRPDDPKTVCYGGEADIASQITAQLRAGAYGGPRFAKVALASHSVMGLASQPEAYSFKDIDALIVTSWADQGFSQRLQDASRESQSECVQADHAEFDPETFAGSYFANADPAVVEAAARSLRAPVPCGEPQSAFQAIGADLASLREVAVPVLLVYGRQDALFQQPEAGQRQAQLFAGSPDVTTEFVDRAGQALALERTAPAYRAVMSRWLSAHGL